MLKKFVKVSVVSIALFYFTTKVQAYEYINKSNESNVNNIINEIYDAKEQYESLVGGYKESETIIHNATDTSYWWPIGSDDTTESSGKVYAKGEPSQTSISSPFGYRENPFNESETVFHSGLDITSGMGNGVVNIIAARDGVVVYPTAEVQNNCPSSNSSSTCGGGYGNYVIIQHSDGNFTLYGHMHEGTITVKAGDSVTQGQVIGKMGSSGNSTGTHLHFEVREGQNNISSAVDPASYVSMENPRAVISGGVFLNWLNSWEGHSPIEGNNYVVENIGDGVRTVGSGVVLEFNSDRFSAYGIDVSKYPVGSKISISIVDQIQLEKISSVRSDVENVLSQSGITLQENQIQALVDMKYNAGNINGFAEAYKKYGNTSDLYDNWFLRSISKGTQFEQGLTRRRNAEWSLFSTGEYVYNG